MMVSRYSEFQSLRPELKRAATEELLARQGYKCAHCGNYLRYQRTDSETMPAVDHDHASDLIRGILHGKCNRDLGSIEGQPDWWHAKAREYLKRSGSRDPYAWLGGDGNRALAAPNRVDMALGVMPEPTLPAAPVNDEETASAYRALSAGLGLIRSPFGDPWDLKRSVLLGPVNTALDIAFDRLKKEGKVSWRPGEGFRVESR